MCYAIPGIVEAIAENKVTVSYYGEKKQALNELAGLNVGDYVYAQGGFVIQKVAPAEAREILQIWKDLFFELQKTDNNISRLTGVQTDNKKLGRILDRAMENKIPDRAAAQYLLELADLSDQELLFKTANFIRQKNQKNSCCVHGIIELSNHCVRNCGYCGISLHNRELRRYRMSREEILETVKTAVEKYSFKALVLQSGEGAYPIDELAAVIREIKARWPVLIFISFGEIGADGLHKLYAAGARGLLLRFETANPRLYEQIHPGYALEQRLAEIQKAREIGYLIVTGSLIGIPGQTVADLVEGVFLAKDLAAEMYSFGPFLPHPQTPLAEVPPPDEGLVRKVLALARLINPLDGRILVTTGLETLKASARAAALGSGANSVMLNVTPLPYRRLYSIYPGRAHETESISRQITETIDLLNSLGRAPTDLGI